MKKWAPKELLCNSRGLDDGYVFLHKDHPLSKETMFILNTKDEYTKDKFRLSDKDIARVSCFFGFFRKPLSHEMHSTDDDSIVPLPPTSSKISRSSDVFDYPIEPNMAVCFAFTEPSIKGHRSEILGGAVLHPSILTDEDRRIRRPRLNRGGDTIANLGGQNRSHQSGYGSMNINSYERDLAMKNGRGKQMNQAGTRSWGSMEPTPKRFNGGQFPVTPQVPTIQRWQPPPPPNFPPPPPHPNINWQPPHPASQTQQYSQGYQQQQQYNSYAGVINQQAMGALAGNGYNQHLRWDQNATSAYQQQNYAQQQNYGYNPPNQFQNGFAFNQQRQAQQQVQSSSNQPSQRQNGFAFNQQGQQRLAQQQQAQSNFSFNQQGIQQQQQQQQQRQQQQQQQQQPQTGGRANLTNLRAQLLSTLQNQRKGN